MAHSFSAASTTIQRQSNDSTESHPAALLQQRIQFTNDPPQMAKNIKFFIAPRDCGNPLFHFRLKLATIAPVMRVHASCAALNDDAVLLVGPPGAGKSDLLLRLIDRGFALIGDDQIIIEGGQVRPCTAIAGMVELRGLGLFELEFRPSATLRLIVQLGAHAARLPAFAPSATPMIALDPSAPSAPIRVHWALDAACGRRTQRCGAFAA
jgi:HPr kinase/phosphorylase